MKMLIIMFCICVSNFEAFSQSNVLISSTLSPALLKNAHSVKREEKINFEVKSIDEATLTVHQVFTILDAEGEDALFFQQYTDQFRKLEDAEIKVYDAMGKAMNKYKKREMNAQATGEGLVDDGKVYYFRVAAPSYPITVQYDYEMRYKGTLVYPDFDIEWPDQSVEYASYTASVPAALDLRYKPKNISLQPEITVPGKNKLYKWEIKNLAAIEYEKGAAIHGTNYPSILISPNRFSMDGYEGDLTSWKSFGLWSSDLSKDALNLGPDAKSRMAEMTKSAKDNKEKIAIIYNYLKHNFRYVSIQLGIGGFKTFDADFVDKKKYGDCKALSNYMKACLDAVGIKSYTALINAGYNSEPVDPLFPHNNFNHVILCVPGNLDTTWLECTSNTSDAGVLGSFTENRNALLITENGGVLVRTPRGVSTENTFNLFTKVNINEDGSGLTSSILKASGEYKDDIMNYIMNEKEEDQKKYVVHSLGFLQPDEFHLSTNRTSDLLETVIDLSIEKIPDFTAGSKMFLNPRIYKIWDKRLPDSDNRSRSYYFECPFQKTDTTVYILPENYSVENLPKARNEKFEYGSFKTDYTYEEKSNSITSVAQLSLYQNIIPANKFKAACLFFSDVIDEYTEKIIIKKK